MKYVIIIVTFFFTLFVFGHSGRTDNDGGHYDRIHGGYHYHHGQPAHAQCGDECPYVFGRSSGSSGSSWGWLKYILTPIIFLVFIGKVFGNSGRYR